MLLIEPALMTTLATWTIRHQLSAMVDLNNRRARRDLHLLPNQLPWHRITVRVEDDHRVRVDDPGQFPRTAKRWLSVECLELLTFRVEPRQRCITLVTQRPMVNDRRHPHRQAAIEITPTGKGPARYGIVFHVTDATFNLALRRLSRIDRGSTRPTRPWRESPVLGKRPQSLVEDGRTVVLTGRGHQRFRVIQQDRLRHPTKMPNRQNDGTPLPYRRTIPAASLAGRPW